MKVRHFLLPALAALVALSASAASAECLKKGAVATAESEKSAKWYALETMVQSVSWGLWPSFVANGTVPGYKISGEIYQCKPEGSLVTCKGQATFCKAS